MFIFFWGWGKKTKQVVISPQRQLVLVYSYFHLMYVFTVAWGPKYIEAQWTEHGWAQRQVDKAEAAYIAGGVAPEIPWWWRFSLLGGVFLVIAIPFLIWLGSLLFP